MLSDEKLLPLTGECISCMDCTQCVRTYRQRHSGVWLHIQTGGERCSSKSARLSIPPLHYPENNNKLEMNRPVYLGGSPMTGSSRSGLIKLRLIKAKVKRGNKNE